LLVCRVDAPDARLLAGRTTLDPRQPWLTAGSQVRARWDRSAQVRALVIDHASAQARLRQITGDDRLVLRSSGLAPKDAHAARRWERMFSYLDDALAEEPGDDTILAAEWERHALAVTLDSFPTSVVDALARPVQTRAAPTSVRRAVAFIEENAQRPITVDDIAAAAFISTRGLQYAFRRAMDVTPAEYLRQERLEGAHRELADCADDSIASIARRWGFSHPSRFAAAYRVKYGTAPSTTSARRRRR
jgi:AraC-like DNA-binding protein